MLVITKQEINELMDNWLASIYTGETTVSFDKLRDILTKQMNNHHINLLIDEYENWL